MKKLKLIIGFVAITTVLTSLAINKATNYPNINFKHLKVTKNHLPEIQEKIFNEREIITDELNNLLNFKNESNNSNNVKATIDDEKIEKFLVPFILENLKKLAHKKGWNPNHLDGKIYYEINNLKIDLYVTWRISIYENNHTHFDRFEITFK